MHRLQDLVRLHRMGEETRTVARLLKMGRNTQRKYRDALKAEGLLDGPAGDIPDIEALKAAVTKHESPQAAPQEISSIEAWQPRIQALLNDGLKARAIYDRLRQDHQDFIGSYWSVKRLARRLKRQLGVRAEDVAIPVETAAGEVAQVDFGEIAPLIDLASNVSRRAWVFVMVLGYSRHFFAKIVFDQKIETWLRLHNEAFEAFGGVPKTIVSDNLKAAVIRAAFGVSEATELNRSYRELARHYGFKVVPRRSIRPRKRAKSNRRSNI